MNRDIWKVSLNQGCISCIIEVSTRLGNTQLLESTLSVHRLRGPELRVVCTNNEFISFDELPFVGHYVDVV